jgi:ABC-2 type transport system ATP-binding protein
LTRRFGALTAVEGLELSIAPGEIFGLVGPDGAGKTTILRMLAGLVPPSAGEAFVHGLPVARGGEALSATLGYMAQRFGLYVDLTVAENLAFHAALRGIKDRQRQQELLGFVGLAEFHARPAGALSGGMKQKLALACALVHVPPVLLLDEPTNGVDPVSRRDYWRLLYKLVRERGTTIVVATAYLDEAERCGRLALVHRGRVRALADPAGLRGSLEGTMLELRPPQPRAAADALRPHFAPGLVGLYGDRVHVLARDVDATTARIRALGVEPGPIAAIEPTLEDVFVVMLAGEEGANA